MCIRIYYADVSETGPTKLSRRTSTCRRAGEMPLAENPQYTMIATFPGLYSFSGRTRMRHSCLALAVAIATLAPSGSAQQGGQYKVLKTARVGGEGGWDYIYADVAGRRLYIPRRGTPATPDVQTRLTIFNLDTLEPVGEIAGVGGNCAAIDPKWA